MALKSVNIHISPMRNRLGFGSGSHQAPELPELCPELLTIFLKTENHSYVVNFCYIYFTLQVKARHIIIEKQTVAITCFQYFILLHSISLNISMKYLHKVGRLYT